MKEAAPALSLLQSAAKTLGAVIHGACRVCPIRASCRVGSLYPEGEKYKCVVSEYRELRGKIKDFLNKEKQ